MAKKASKKTSPCSDYETTYKEKRDAIKKLLAETSDEEIGKMFRQRKEANEFLAARGLY